MPNEWSSSEAPNVRTIDPVTGIVTAVEFSTARPSDFPNLEIPDPAISDPGGLRNLTDAEQAAGSIGHPSLLSSHTIALTGGGQPGSIFAATIDGKVFAEQIYTTGLRNTSAAAIDVAQGLRKVFPYLSAEASGSSILVKSMNPSLTIAAPPSPLPLPIPTLMMGTELPKENDVVQIRLNNQSVTVQFDGTETLPDIALMKIYMAIEDSPMNSLSRMVTYFVNSYSDSYIYFAPYVPFTFVQVLNYGQINMRFGPMNVGASNFGFTLT